ncbi:MAG TPA: hypothetical protein PKD83_02370 [Ignavibacteria bacterium]|nr:hypothetical protein [Ignavibacteria bacterium]
MKDQWFIKAGWIYIPKSVIGILLYLMTIAFCVTVFIAIDSHSHSNSDTLYGIFPYFISAFTVLFWIAGNKSKETTH